MALPLLLSFLGSGLAKAGVLGAAGSFLSNPLIMGAIGSGLGTAIETGDIKKGIGAGLGSFAGGRLLGGMMGGAGGAMGAPLAGQSTVGTGAGAMTTGTPLQATPNMAGLMPPAATGGLRDIARAGMQFGQSAQGIGSMLGSSVGAGMIAPTSPTGGSTPAGRPLPPMQRQVRTPGPDYVPGQSGEFDYGVSTPYTAEYASKYAPTRMAGGGMVMQRNDSYHGPLMMQAGGIANIGAMSAEPAAAKPNEREVISAAVAAIRGAHPQPEVALGAFLAQYGEEALRDLVDRVQSGEMEQSAAESEGKVAGPGDGMNDMIPASIDGQQDVLLSDGEYIVPADVVSGLGNGSSDAGAKALDAMRDKVRMARTGKAKQAPAVPQERMMPV